MTKLITTMILAFLPIMPIIDVEKVEAKIRRQRLGIHGEDEDSESDIASSENATPEPDNILNRGGTATKGSDPFGGGGGGGGRKGTTGPKKQKDTKDKKNPKDTSLWKKLWDWLFG